MKVQDKQMAAAAEGVVWLPYLSDLVRDNGGTYDAFAHDLLQALLKRADATTKDFGWPKSARGMAEALVRHAPALRVVGLGYRAVPNPHKKTDRHYFDLAGVAGVAGVETPSVRG